MRRYNCLLSSSVLIVIELYSSSLQFNRVRRIICRPGIPRASISLIVQKAQAKADVSDTVDDTLTDLSIAIQNVGSVVDFSNIKVSPVRIAAIYLTAAVMDCLTNLIDWVTKSRTLLFYFALC